MFNFDIMTNENNAQHNSKWLCIPDHPYRILIGRFLMVGCRFWIRKNKCIIQFTNRGR